jgi:hypothetical protein
VRRAHAGLHGAERVFDGLTTLAHGERVRIKALLHSVEQMLVLPTCKLPVPRSPFTLLACNSIVYAR